MYQNNFYGTIIRNTIRLNLKKLEGKSVSVGQVRYTGSDKRKPMTARIDNPFWVLIIKLLVGDGYRQDRQAQLLKYIGEEAICMYRLGVITGVCWVALFYSTVAAFDFQRGIHGMQWGDSVSNYEDLTKVKDLDQAAYYANSQMIYETANQPVPGVFYGFYLDQFFAVFIKLRSPNQFSHLERQFTKKYGTPKITRNTKSRLTVYRWKDSDVSIKLKLRESPAEYKMAMYYLPLAARFNQDQLEKAAPDARISGPSENNMDSKPVPLIGY